MWNFIKSKLIGLVKSNKDEIQEVIESVVNKAIKEATEEIKELIDKIKK